jgi:DNA-binding response OmpR family regulator
MHPGLDVDPAGRDVLVGGVGVALTAREFDLLYLLASHPGAGVFPQLPARPVVGGNLLRF